jgi:hypothetical protein
MNEFGRAAPDAVATEEAAIIAMKEHFKHSATINLIRFVYNVQPDDL